MSEHIMQCSHCGERYLGSARYCKFCSTAEKRKAIDKENKQIRENLKKKYGQP